MAENPEKEALDALLHSDGWKYFAREIKRLWGVNETGGEEFIRAVTKATEDGSMSELQQVVRAKAEISKVMSWPLIRLEALTHHDDASREPSLSRRGSL